MILLQETIARSAERHPHATAMVWCGERITYGELDETSNRLARVLTEAGCRMGDRIGVLAPKSIAAITSFLGALKAGCIYVPMDTESPAARLSKIVDACEPRCILATPSTENLLKTLLTENAISDATVVGWLAPGRPSDPAIRPAFYWEDLAAVPPHPLPRRPDPSDPAHILFTSGSTGVPKGVIITHANVIHFLEWARRYFQPQATDRISCHPPLHFDLSTFDIYGTFLAGAELHLVPPQISLLPHKLADFIRSAELTQWHSVPAALKYMAQFDVVRFGDFPSLKRLLWCGEALPTPTLTYFMKRLPHVSFTNLYGPTEATIASSYYTVPCCPQGETAEIPIGQPCDGEDLLVLNESLDPAGAGEIGELYIRGVGLSPGYWNDRQKTASVFLSDSRHGRIYRTGDLARIGPDGLVYLLGRADSQIKSRGYRIELGEIETALNGLGILRECAVVAVGTSGFEGKVICCAYVPAPGRLATSADLRRQLTKVLPLYMMPSQWLKLDALPLNANGKIDRPRLRDRFMVAAMGA
jgi:amino acid adenylation domain-containing protein